MKKIRINVLARELEVKSHLILELLPDLGVSEKVTHSSSIDEDVADKLRVRFGIEPVGSGNGPSATESDEDGHNQGIALEELPAVEAQPEQRGQAIPSAPADVAPPRSQPEAAPEPPVTEAPVRPSAPLRPPMGSPGTPAPVRPVVAPTRPMPMGPRPGQILSPPPVPTPVPGQVLSGGPSAPGTAHAPDRSGPRQPFPGGLPEGSRAPVIPRPPVTQRNLATPPLGAPQAPRAAGPPVGLA